jgi:hypothetical protein
MHGDMHDICIQSGVRRKKPHVYMLGKMSTLLEFERSIPFEV